MTAVINSDGQCVVCALARYSAAGGMISGMYIDTVRHKLAQSGVEATNAEVYRAAKQIGHYTTKQSPISNEFHHRRQGNLYVVRVNNAGNHALCEGAASYPVMARDTAGTCILHNIQRGTPDWTCSPTHVCDYTDNELMSSLHNHSRYSMISYQDIAHIMVQHGYIKHECDDSLGAPRWVIDHSTG